LAHAQDLPRPASPESGWPLVPVTDVAAVVDTKTYFTAPEQYADQTVFNYMNDATEAQSAFLGPGILKIILSASSSVSPESLRAEGLKHGLQVFSLARYKAGPVSDGANRQLSWKLETFADGSYPLQRFKEAVLDAVLHFQSSHVTN